MRYLLYGIGVLVVIIVLRAIAKRSGGKKRIVAVVTLNHAIEFGDVGSSFHRFAKALKKACRLDPGVIILRVNSPGGTVGASQEICDMLTEVKRKKIKVIALMEDVAASGGLYVCMAADYVVANAGALTGSIGVIIRGMDYSKVVEFLRLGINTIKSGKFKDIMSPTRPMSDEEKLLLQGLIDDSYSQFCECVATSRKIPLDDVKKFADGRILTGRQAKSLGLVDEVGGYNTAVAKACEFLGIDLEKADVHEIDIRKFPGGRLARFLPASVRFLFDVEEGSTAIQLWRMP